MTRRLSIFMAISLLLASCEEEGKPSYIPNPAVDISVLSVGLHDACVEIQSINASQTRYLCAEKDEVRNVEAEAIYSAGTPVEKPRFTIDGLEEKSEYHIFAVAVNSEGRYSAVKRDTLVTPNDPSNDIVADEPLDKEMDENGLYRWERGRDPLPEFADMALCYGGHSARNPRVWDKNRFRKTAVYTDQNGQDHWFFDSMLMLEIWDDNYKVTYSIANDGKSSSRKHYWTGFLDYWFDSRYGFQALDDCIAEAAAQIGTPPSPRYVVVSIPDPVYFENYSKGVSGKDKNTVYWGEIDGTPMDFSRMEHRLQAYRWFIDQVRARFAQKEYRYIQLLGFYIISESLSMQGGWRYEYKQHEELIPQVADYCHSVNEGLYWIPYSVSDDDPGHNRALQNWRQFGFDLTILQPNYYWDNKDWDVTCDYINRYDMGMEFEFEGSHGYGTSILGNSDAAKRNKARFTEYMDNARKYGIYGKKPIVLYTGTNALYELAVSEETSDIDLYHEFGEFIVNSPLKY
ncbi:MAG: DUF4855 domain-containing protein [Bacteroidales bacterium]|nr:DUF4855 domain-containing protein [Bacteroidales bacterium]